MTASLDWARIVADLDMVRFQRGLTWVQMADRAGVEDYSVWRLKREKGVISASALLPLLAWAGLTELGRYIKDSPDYRIAAQYRRGPCYAISGPRIEGGAGANRYAQQNQDDAPEQAAAQELHDSQHDKHDGENPQKNSHDADHNALKPY